MATQLSKCQKKNTTHEKRSGTLSNKVIISLLDIIRNGFRREK